MRCMIYEKNLSSLALHDTDQGHGIPPATVIMDRNGANAFIAATLLQLTPDSSLHHLFCARQFFQGFLHMVVNLKQNGN